MAQRPTSRSNGAAVRRAGTHVVNFIASYTRVGHLRTMQYRLCSSRSLSIPALRHISIPILWRGAFTRYFASGRLTFASVPAASAASARSRRASPSRGHLLHTFAPRAWSYRAPGRVDAHVDAAIVSHVSAHDGVDAEPHCGIRISLQDASPMSALQTEYELTSRQQSQKPAYCSSPERHHSLPTRSASQEDDYSRPAISRTSHECFAEDKQINIIKHRKYYASCDVGPYDGRRAAGLLFRAQE
jgi:hypothetical protein